MIRAILDFITGKTAARKRAEIALEQHKRQVMLDYWAARRDRDDAEARGDCRGYGNARMRMEQINFERIRLNL